MLSRVTDYSSSGVEPLSAPFPPRERHPTLTDVAKRSDREDYYIARIGPLLQSLRKDTINPATGKPYTQAQAAEAVSMDPETLGRWERKLYPPKVWELAPLATLYGLPRRLWYQLLSPHELPARSVRQHLLEREADDLAAEATAGQQLPIAGGGRGVGP